MIVHTKSVLELLLADGWLEIQKERINTTHVLIKNNIRLTYNPDTNVGLFRTIHQGEYNEQSQT